MGHADRTRTTIFAALAVAGLSGIAVSQRAAPATGAPGKAEAGPNRESRLSAIQALSADRAEPGGNGGIVCKGAVTGSGEAKFQSTAEHNAKGNWHGVAASTYGGTWDWNKASGHSTNCRHNGLGPLQRRWTCTATAEPCEEVITCKPSTIQVEGGSAKLQSGAEANAVNQWESDASNAWGAGFANWNYAASRSTSCRHNGLGPIQRRWRCTARGRPCG